MQARLNQDGLWGFTGILSSEIAAHKEPPSPSLLPTCLPALSEWGVTEDKLIRSEKGTEEEEKIVKEMGKEVQEFITKRRWNEREWETAWFVNPPVGFIKLFDFSSRHLSLLLLFSYYGDRGFKASLD